MDPGFPLTLEDQMQPQYCSACRAHSSASMLAAFNGMCQSCRKADDQRRATSTPAAVAPGQATPPMPAGTSAKRSTSAVTLLALAALAIICIAVVPTTVPGTQTPASSNLQLTDTHEESVDHLRYVVGTVRNTTDRTYGYVQVSINLYDGGTQVGSTMANVNNLEPHGTWTFKAVIADHNATSFKVKEVTGF